jgi:NAD(P)H-dependent FMN reductase
VRNATSDRQGRIETLRVAIVSGSTRPGRHNEAVARWVHRLAAPRTDAAFELVDIADYKLPLLDEAPCAMKRFGIAW